MLSCSNLEGGSTEKKIEAGNLEIVKGRGWAGVKKHEHTCQKDCLGSTHPVV